MWVCKEMKEQGVKPNLLMYNDILKLAAKDGFYTVVEGIMDDMLAMGIQPDRQSYHHLLYVRQVFPSLVLLKQLKFY
jgi:pentatricopeptide repeat protein